LACGIEGSNGVDLTTAAEVQNAATAPTGDAQCKPSQNKGGTKWSEFSFSDDPFDLDPLVEAEDLENFSPDHKIPKAQPVFPPQPPNTICGIQFADFTWPLSAGSGDEEEIQDARAACQWQTFAPFADEYCRTQVDCRKNDTECQSGLCLYTEHVTTAMPGDFTDAKGDNLAVLDCEVEVMCLCECFDCDAEI